mgnify:CR=1 FL=1
MHKSFHSDYFQAIIQLRPADSELIKFLENQLRHNDKVWVAKKLNVKTGVDYYISSNKFARMLGKKMKEAFDGTLTESKKLFGWDKLTSKNLYRVTVCFRLKPKEDA